MENSFNELNKEYLDKKREIELEADKAIKELSDAYKEKAINAGYSYDESKNTFTLDSCYVLDYQICSLGKPNTKPEYKLIHNVKYLTEDKFMEYASKFDCPVINYNSASKAKVLTEILAEDVGDFYRILTELSQTNSKKGRTLLLEQGLTSRSFTCFYPTGSEVFNYYESIKVFNYYGGFSIRLNNLSATFHLYQITKESKPYIEEYLNLECHGKMKETEAYFGIQNAVYK
ncbi:MAG: hypothetical protein MJ246_05285 [Clostridia bacterium]|nr:hypothetical protein [Clostridia bacterium]